MPNVSSPLVALVVLVVGALAVGVFFVVERRHARPNRSAKMAERLPLFGTDRLAIRSASGLALAEPGGHDVGGHDVAVRPARPTSTRPVAEPSADRGPNGRVGPTNGRPASSFAPPVPLVPPAPSPSPAPAPAPVATTPPTPLAAPRAPRDARESRPVHTPPSWDAVPVTPRVAALATAEQPRVTRSRAPSSPAIESVVVGERSVVDAALIEGETLRFTVPTDATAEFLPGRLEVVAGPDAGREIRFMRTPGESNVEITFGRSEGPAHRHVQILARTVSRQHAVMSLIDEHWQLTNVSATNPLVVNGRVLATNEVAPLLLEGDRIEMGEVVFVFRDA